MAEALGRREQLAPAGIEPSHEFYTTGDPEEFSRLGSRVWRAPLPEVRYLSVDELVALPDARLLDMAGEAEVPCV